MRKLIAGAFGALIVGLALVWAQPSPAWLAQKPAAATYTGPGDVTTFAYWGGVWAYSAAQRGTKALNVCNVSDVACADVSSDATTGKLPTSISIGGSDCASVTCTVKIVYDQTGNAQDQSSNTISARATLTKTGCPSGTVWCLSSTTNTVYVYGTGGPGTQPVSATAVWLTTANTTRQHLLENADVSPFTVMALGASDCTSGNACINSSGACCNQAVSNSTWYALQGVFNGASPASMTLLNGNTVTGTTTGMSWGTSTYPRIGYPGIGLIGLFTEMGWAASAWSGGTQSSVESNERTRNSF